MPRDEATQQVSVAARLFCGGVAGALGQTVAYPLNVARRQLQTSGFAGQAVVPRRVGAIWHQIVSSEGARGLFRGLAIHYVKAVPMVAISFTAYDLIMVQLNRLNLQ